MAHFDNLGKALRRLREEKGWNQDQAARTIGVSASQLSNYETGAKRPSLPRQPRRAAPAAPEPTDLRVLAPGLDLHEVEAIDDDLGNHSRLALGGGGAERLDPPRDLHPVALSRQAHALKLGPVDVPGDESVPPRVSLLGKHLNRHDLLPAKTYQHRTRPPGRTVPAPEGSRPTTATSAGSAGS
jgi:Helix-turn-helix domain